MRPCSHALSACLIWTVVGAMPAAEAGIAAAYPGDAGLAGDPRVLLVTDFSDPAWRQPWGAKEQPTAGTVTEDAQGGFVPFDGPALRVTVEQGRHYGTSMAYRFQRQTGAEPEEIYFRYYLRFGSTWKPTGTSGKLPGIGGTYDRAGWGGRVADGRNGWSARGLFRSTKDGRTPIGFYCYHTAMGRWGSEWVWTEGERGFLAHDRWYCIEQHVRLNTPAADGRGEGARDGILRGWVDGELAFAKEDVCFRHVGDLRIDRVWIDVYHGGDATPAHDMHLYIDNAVIATSYIGPVVATPSAPRSALPAAPRRTQPQRPAPDPAVVDAYRQRLRERVAVALAEGCRPRFRLGLVGGDVRIEGLSGAVADVVAGDGSRLSLDLFPILTPADASSLAQDLARNRDHPQDHAVAAFFLLIAGDPVRADEHLRRAGTDGDAVRSLVE